MRAQQRPFHAVRHFALGLILAVETGCQAPAALAPPAAGVGFEVGNNAGAPPPAPQDVVGARIGNLNVQDWSSNSLGGEAVTRLRREAPKPKAPLQAPGFGIKAIGGADAFWPAAGVTLASISGALTGHHAVNGPAWAYRSPIANLQDRIWYLTSNGSNSYVVGVKAQEAPTAGNSIVINLARHVSRGYLALSDDGTRLYAIADNGDFVMVRPAEAPASQVTAISMGAAAVGISPFIDPITTNINDGAARDFVFAATNSGMVYRFLFNGTTLAVSGTPRSVTTGLTTALDGSTTLLLRASPVALNNRVYIGDRGGNLRILNFSDPAPTALTTRYLFTAKPVETSVALDLDTNLVALNVFVPTGSRMAWYAIAGNRVTVSRPLLIDKGTTPEGTLSAFSYTANPTAANLAFGTAASYPDDSSTVLVANTPPNPSLVLPNSNPPSGPDRRVRYNSVGGAQVIRRLDANCLATHFTGNNNWGSADGTLASLPGGTADNGKTMGSAIGPQGELILAGSGESNDGTLRIIPAVSMTNSYGLAGPLLPGRMYRILAEATGRDARSVAYFNAGTPGTGDDFLYWVERPTGRVCRVRRDSGTPQVIETILDDGAGAAGPPASIGPQAPPLLYNISGGDRNCGLSVTANGDVFVGVRNDPSPNDSIIRLRPVGAQWRMDRLYQAAGDDIYVDDLTYDPFTDAVYLACVFSHTVQRFTPPLANTPGPLTIYAGVLNSSGDAANGTDRLSAQINQPSTLTADPSSGDLYIGEFGGRRVKLIYGPTHDTNPNQIFKIAGNGTDGAIGNCNGPMNSNSALGAIGTMRVGPENLALPLIDPFKYLYFYTRTAYYEGRLDYDTVTLPATTKGLMRWNTEWPTTGSVIDAQVRLRVKQTVNSVPRTDLSVASTTYDLQPAVQWSSAGLETATNLPPTHNTTQSSYCQQGDPTEQLTWTAGSQLIYDLSVDSLATTGSGGRFALAITPPNNGLDYHYDGGLAPPSAATNARQSLDFLPHSDGTAGNRPTMRALFSPYTQPSPISAPPTIYADGAIRYVFVYHNNALFRLDFTSATTFDTATVFATTRIGRQGGYLGPLDERLATKSFLPNLTAPLITSSGQAVLLDYRPTAGSWDFSLNRLNGLAAPSSMFTEAFQMNGLAVTPPTGSAISTFATYNSFGGDAGSIYFGLANGRIYRLNF